MRIAVMGAGVVGVTTAHELVKDGHEVVVIERHDKPAADTSWTLRKTSRESVAA